MTGGVHETGLNRSAYICIIHREAALIVNSTDLSTSLIHLVIPFLRWKSHEYRFNITRYKARPERSITDGDLVIIRSL